MVIWIIGLSASGKTTLGRKIDEKLKRFEKNTVFLDGDMIRDVMGNDLGFSIEDRWKNAQRISKLCWHLEKQGLNVVCSILSIFHESQKWNRENFDDYNEIYLKVAMDVLLKREIKGIYKAAFAGEKKNVVGVDMTFPEPLNPDLIVNNNEERFSFDELAVDCLKKLNIPAANYYKYSAPNLFLQKEKYEYTQFEGMNFLDTFQNNRQKSIQILENKITYLEKYSENQRTKNHAWVDFFGINKNANLFFDNEITLVKNTFEGTENIVIRDFLINQLQELIENSAISQTQKVIALMQRFEVSKRVYTLYNAQSMKKASSSYQEISNYALLAILLGQLHDKSSKEQKLSYTNAILKINDILQSVLEKINSPVDIILTIIAFKQELKIYKKLYKEKIA